MFAKVAVNNRGAVAARIIRTLAALKIKSAVFCSEADQDLPYVREADEFRVIGPAPPLESYLNRDRVAAAVKDCRADALHPGYGFLAEDALLASRLEEAGTVFIGPRPRFLTVFGDKVAAQKVMAARGLPVNPATGILEGTLEEQIQAASALGFPLLIKPAGGGGGIGMVPAFSAGKLAAALETAASQALRSFGKTQLYAERLISNPRHVEFQIVTDGQGGGFHLFERDCSVQRRRQKVIEEAPAPLISRPELARLADLSVRVMTDLGYNHIGTLETLYGEETGFSFLEVNPRLQVEHGVTEEVTGTDLAAMQIILAAGGTAADLPAPPEAPAGHAVEARIYAEDSQRFLPSPGVLKVFRPPKGEGIRVETGYAEGARVTPFYDPMTAQVIAWGRTRREAVSRLDEALAAFEIEGIKTNIPFVRAMLAFEPFAEGRVHTGLTEALLSEPHYQSLWKKQS
jgi:acetyl-CoA carboxylase biotin carboxylase subunit